MESAIAEVLFSKEQIQTRIREMAELISREYADKDPIVVGVLKGVVVFYADMIRAFNFPCQMDFMCISSYSGTSSTGNMVIKKDVSANIAGRHVLILEDIFDTGRSLDFSYHHLMEKGPASVRICTLLDKPDRRDPKVTVTADYTGFVIPNKFVVGYGLDFNEHYRNLPYVGVLKPEAYEK